ncbi:MAG: hypothetical protein KC613_02635, partial [Myxococcales bacterium]|nr:hypothetical protein [Myxococcales bacterium]
VDDDCDGARDNGLCCESADQALYSERLIPNAYTEGGVNAGFDAEQFLLADVENQDAWRVAIRYSHEGQTRWTGRVIYTSAETRNAPVERMANFGDRVDAGAAEPWPVDAVEGIAMRSVGGYSLVLGRNAEGHVTASWTYYVARNSEQLGNGAPKEPEDLDVLHACGDLDGDGTIDPAPAGAPPTWPVLAVDTIDHTDQAASALVICPRKALRLYPQRDPQTDEPRPNVEIPLTTLNAENSRVPLDVPARWATIRRVDGDVIPVIYGYERDGAWEVMGGNFVAGNTNRLQLTRPGAFADVPATAAELGAPIYSHPDIIGPYLQILDGGRAARVRVRGADGRWSWQPVVAGDDVELAYNPAQARLVAARRTGDTTDFYMLDLSDREDLNLWTTRPVLSVTAPEVRWALSLGAAPGQFFIGGYRDVLAVFTRDLEGAWRVVTHGVDCRGN